MSIPVYVKPVAVYPHRTTWDNSGGTNYVIDDRVEYDDGALHRVYVCITDNNSTTTPDNDPSNWAPAGTKEHPFMSGDDGELAKADLTASECCLRSGNGFTQWDPARSLSVSDGSTRAHVILMDGKFNLAGNEYYSLYDTDFYAENHQKTWIIQNYYDQAAAGHTDENNCPIFNNLKIAYINNECDPQASVIYKDCYITDDSPWGYGSNINLRFNELKFTQAFNTTFKFLHSPVNLLMYNQLKSAVYGHATLDSCTFYLASSYGQFATFFYGSTEDVHVSNCIFYVDTLNHTAAGSLWKFFRTAGYKAKNNKLYFKNAGNQADVYLDLGSPTNLGGNEINIDPLFIDEESGADLRLRPSSPLIGGGGKSNPAGVYIQPGSGTGGSGTFEDPYYLGELASAESSAASGNGIIYFVDGEYNFSGSLDLFADGITYKSLNKHKAILGSADSSLTQVKIINIGGGWNNTNLGVGNITLEDFSVKNVRFQQVSNDVLRPNKIKGLKIEDTHPIGHATDGFLWSNDSKFIIESCFISLDFGTESSYYLGRGTSETKILNTTLIINFSLNSGAVTFPDFESVENSIIHGIAGVFAYVPQSNFLSLTAVSKNCCFYNIGYNISYGGENTYQGDPLFIDPSSKDFRLRPDSPLIGGIKSGSSFPNGSIWVSNTSGAGGAGTEEDPYYFDSINQAHTDAGPYGSIVFKNGVYDTGAGMHIFNPVFVNNSVNYYAETIGGVEFISESFGFGHSGLNVTESLNYTGFKFTSTETSFDGFVFDQSTNNSIAAHVFSSCRFYTNHSFFEGYGQATNPGKIIFKNTHFSKLSANFSNPPYLFEQRNGTSGNSELFLENCIVENRSSTSNGPTYIFNRMSVTLKNTIILDYSNNSTGLVVEGTSNLEGLNSILHENGTDFHPNESNLAVDPLFVSPGDDNWSLRPSSPLIGKG